MDEEKVVNNKQVIETINFSLENTIGNVMLECNVRVDDLVLPQKFVLDDEAVKILKSYYKSKSSTRIFVDGVDISNEVIEVKCKHYIER